MADPQTAAQQQLLKFKSQPWLLFDTIVSSSFLCGDTTTPAIGQSTPAISKAGEIDFFQSGNRLAASMPWYTNLDLAGQLSYGMEVWAIYIALLMPKTAVAASFGNATGVTDPLDSVGPSSVDVLAAALLNHGVLTLQLGQEPQCDWPLHRFGAGGGYEAASALTNVQNAIPEAVNLLTLPEPIEMPRTQNLSAKIQLSPEGMETIGTPTAVGVGGPLDPFVLGVDADNTVSVAFPPYAIQLGLVGRRIKDTQYGQIPG